MLVAKTVVNPTSGKIPLKIMNVSSSETELHKHSFVGSMERASLFQGDSLHFVISEISLVDTPTKLPEHLEDLYEES